jgi:acyl-homoserine lactone acylase PvdQ
VPHIYANDTRGLFYGYGYAVAEDRLFQMEMARRSVLGTVAEVLGPSYVALDRGSQQPTHQVRSGPSLRSSRPTIARSSTATRPASTPASLRRSPPRRAACRGVALRAPYR